MGTERIQARKQEDPGEGGAVVCGLVSTGRFLGGAQRKHPRSSLEVDPETQTSCRAASLRGTAAPSRTGTEQAALGVPGPAVAGIGRRGLRGAGPSGSTVQTMGLWGRAKGRGPGAGRGRGLRQPHLHHVHEVAEAHGLVDGQVTVAVQHAVVDDVAAEADAQHVVAGVPRGLAHQEQPVLGRLQLLHGLVARDLPVEPPAAGPEGTLGPGRPSPPAAHPGPSPDPPWAIRRLTA